MRTYFLVTFFLLTISTNGFCQTIINSNTFTITGKLLDRDTGTIALFYTDTENINAWDSATLKNGEFKFTGKVNKVSDAYIWTDLKNKNFSDPSVIRFLLEPNDISILYNKPNAVIKGSKTQLEKENFDREKSNLLILKNKFLNKIDSMYKLPKLHSDPIIKQKIDELYTKIDSINKYIKPIDLEYIKRHRNSYLSGFLLSSNKRKLSIDTLQVYYSLLTADVKSSTEGRKVIEYVYPLTNDIDFRNKNPIFGVEYNKRLNELRSVYDVSLNDTSGNLINFKDFKGRYLLIDFWASWCQPCIANFPFMEKLMEEYKSDSIQFISVSLDTDSIKWKKAIIKYNIQGIQLSDLKAFKGVLPVFCKVVTSIPRYVLINKEGQIINLDVPQPMDPELKIILDKLLSKRVPNP